MPLLIGVNMWDIIKCGRKTYELVNGDTVSDNGSCLRLITRKERKGWDELHPSVSKKEFNKFKKLPNVVKKVVKKYENFEVVHYVYVKKKAVYDKENIIKRLNKVANSHFYLPDSLKERNMEREENTEGVE